MTPRGQRRCAGWAVAVVAAAALFCWRPLFRVVPLQAARQPTTGAAFDAEVFGEKFWREQLLATDRMAHDAGRLMATLRLDSSAAVELGRRLGLSRAVCFVVAGVGRITELGPEAVRLALDGEDGAGSIVIEAGPLFGNALRDGTGLLDVSAFPNSQDFNAISSALNRRVETEVLPGLRAKAARGARLRFLGCAEVDDPAAWTPPLRVVPVRLEWP